MGRDKLATTSLIDSITTVQHGHSIKLLSRRKIIKHSHVEEKRREETNKKVL
jgi:hypothetical protein